jgi:hypothetical protein
MNNEKSNRYKTLFFFDYQVQTLLDAIIIAQNSWGDKKNGTPDWDKTCQSRIDELERIFKHIITTGWKDLPTPPTKEA